jgi:hypothetical protein
VWTARRGSTTGRSWRSTFRICLSNVAYELTVTDTVTGRSKVYRNPLGEFASVGDTAALPPS